MNNENNSNSLSNSLNELLPKLEKLIHDVDSIFSRLLDFKVPNSGGRYPDIDNMAYSFNNGNIQHLVEQVREVSLNNLSLLNNVVQSLLVMQNNAEASADQSIGESDSRINDLLTRITDRFGDNMTHGSGDHRSTVLPNYTPINDMDRQVQMRGVDRYEPGDGKWLEEVMGNKLPPTEGPAGADEMVHIPDYNDFFKNGNNK